MKLERAHFEQIVDELPTGVLVWRLRDLSDDQSLSLAFANASAARFTGVDLLTRTGERFVDLFPTAPLERLRCYVDVVRTGQPYEAMIESAAGGQVESYAVKGVRLDARTVAVMFQNLTRQERALRDLSNVNRFLDSVVESLPLMIFVKDAKELRFERINKAGEQLLGLERSALIGKNDYDFFPKEQADFFVNADRETLSSGAVKDIPAEPIQTASGTRWLNTKKVPIRDTAGNPIHLLGISVDITESRKAAEQLQSAKDSSDAANRELEAFSYSVAHDLRAPLRGIDGFSQALLDDHAQALDEEGKDFLLRIRRGAARMAELIDALLTLSRVTRSELIREQVDLSALAKEVAEQQRERSARTNVTLTIAPSLQVDADARLLRVLLANLFENAFKFTSKKPSAHIDLGMVATHESGPIYFVRDDGVGFDMTYSKRLFTPFERLHSTSDFDGTGVGLAIVHRVVARHGGRVWAEGIEGEGATFYFTLTPGPRSP